MAIAAVVAGAIAAAPLPVAPVLTAVTFPAVALFWAGEIQVWISLPQSGPDRYRAAILAGRSDTLAPQTLAYLDAVDAALGLPAEVRAEIRSELTDHLADSVAALEATGLTRAAAVGEALARLGRADELGHHLRSAHQSTRRLLAGAAGGVWSAGVGVVQGFLAFFGLLVVCLGLAVVLLQKPYGDVFGFWLGPNAFGSSDPAAGSLVGCMLALGPAFLAGRRCVRASSRLSRRGSRKVRWVWALVGSVVLVWLVGFELAVTQSWWVVAFELAVPVLFAAGALAKPDMDLHLPRARSRWLLAPAALVVGGLLLGAVVPTHQVIFTLPVGSPSESSLGYDRVGPNATAPCTSSNPSPVLSNGRCAIVGGLYVGEGFDQPWKQVSRVIHEMWGVGDQSALAGYTSVRFEIWRAAAGSEQLDSYPSATAIEPTEGAAYLTAAAQPVGDGLEFRADLGNVRAGHWLVFVTGVGSDGQRYRLGEPADQPSVFSGTIWDWVTASN